VTIAGGGASSTLAWVGIDWTLGMDLRWLRVLSFALLIDGVFERLIGAE
jgi:hypothetical protein